MSPTEWADAAPTVDDDGAGVDDDGAGVDGYWRDLVTTAMLGTDRRDPPPPPPGPIADLVADTLRPDAAARLLAAVGATAAARRAGFAPGPTAAPLQPPDADRDRVDGAPERPWCPAAAVDTWRRVVAEWSVLEDEWVLTVIEQGWRPAPDALVELLARHRNDSVRRARVMLAGGPSARWLVGHLPELAAGSQRPAAAEAVASLPELPMSPELADLAGRDAHTVASALAAGFEGRAFGPPNRAVLVNLVARVRPAVLLDVAAALEHTRVGQALALADLARLRHRMLVELGVRP